MTDSSTTMLRHSFITTLSLVTICLLGTAVSMKSITTCDFGTSVQHLSCEDGVIGVQTAMYGRKCEHTCSEGRPASQLQVTDCSQTGTVDVIRRRCNGKKVCEIDTNTVRTSDPCVGTFKYLQTNYTCMPANHVVVCEESVEHIRCEEGQVILVLGADYGRHDQTTCSYKRPASQVANVDCSNTNTFSLIYERCNGKQSCFLEPSRALFGDPCHNIYKYLEVAYVCEYPGVSAMMTI